MLSVSKDLVFCLCGRKSNPIRHFNTHCLKQKPLHLFLCCYSNSHHFFFLHFAVPSLFYSCVSQGKNFSHQNFQIWWSIIHPPFLSSPKLLSTSASPFARGKSISNSIIFLSSS